MRTRTLLLTFSLVILLVPRLVAQNAAQSTCRCENELLTYVGVARHSTMGRHLGTTEGRNHLLVGLHFDLPFARRGRWVLGYAPEFVPLLRISNNPAFITLHIQTPDGIIDTRIPYGTKPIDGVGVSPIGLELTARFLSRFRAYGAGALGAAYFSRDVPVPYSRRFNYTFEWGGGVDWNYHGREMLRVGYKFHHISNKYTAPLNPGLDGNVYMISWGRRF